VSGNIFQCPETFSSVRKHFPVSGNRFQKPAAMWHPVSGNRFQGLETVSRHWKVFPVSGKVFRKLETSYLFPRSLLALSGVLTTAMASQSAAFQRIQEQAQQQAQAAVSGSHHVPAPPPVPSSSVAAPEDNSARPGHDAKSLEGLISSFVTKFTDTVLCGCRLPFSGEAIPAA
jgi:hypothetical protein